MTYDCSCSYDMPDVYWSKIRRARKTHSCYECGNAILPGDQYEYAFGVYNGDPPYTPHTCEPCIDIRTWVKNSVPCFCWAHGNMIEDAKEAVNEAHYRAPQETVGLRFGLLRRIELRDRFHAARIAP